MFLCVKVLQRKGIAGLNRLTALQFVGLGNIAKGVVPAIKGIRGLGSVAKLTAVSMGVLRGALVLVGGPIGAALVAATAIASFAKSAKDAKPDISSLRDQVDLLTKSQKQLAVQTAQSNLSNAQAAVIEYEKIISSVKTAITQAEKYGASTDGLTKPMRDY